MVANSPGDKGPDMMENWELRSSARERLAGKWGKGGLAILVQILFLGIAEAVFLPESLYGIHNPFRSLAAVAVSILVQMPLTYGVASFFLKIARNQDPEMKEIFNGFLVFWKSIGVQLVPGLIAFLWSLAIFVPGCIIVLGSAITEALGLNAIHYLVFSGLGLFIVIATSVVSAIVMLRYVLTVYILYDHPDWDVMAVVRQSAKMMQGRRWKFFLLQLSFIGWAIVSIITLGIGFFFLVPYILTSSALFYEDLKNALGTATPGPLAEKPAGVNLT